MPLRCDMKFEKGEQKVLEKGRFSDSSEVHDHLHCFELVQLQVVTFTLINLTDAFIQSALQLRNTVSDTL